ncbi:MAG TPA: ATP-binding protein [Coriobacteriia bacterium]|nr:ATP-binding protein [Coriobacteriia bacterium]
MRSKNLSWNSMELLYGEQRDRPVVVALAISSAYALISVLWIFLSDRALLSGSLRPDDIVLASSIKGALFVVVTATILFLVTERYLARQRLSEDRHLESQREQLIVNQRAVRQGYVDVLDVVTGGRLVLMTEDELSDSLGEEVLQLHELSDPMGLATARRAVACAPEVFDLPDRDCFVLAVTEALTNALKHGRRAEYRVCRTAECVQVVVRDFGPGIDFHLLPKATLIQGFSTTKTMGMGFTIMLEICDRVLLATSDKGTVVVLELELAKEQALPRRQRMAPAAATLCG